MLKKSHIIILLVVAVATLALMKAPSGTMSRFKLAISGVFLPLFGLSTSSHQLWSDAKRDLTPRSELIRQNTQLRLQVEEQQMLLEQMSNAWLEDQRLRTQVGFSRQSRWNLKLAHVVIRDPANWWRSLQIDLGARDGVKPNYPVLTPEGLVGRVMSVGETRSQVVILGDPTLEVSAKTEPTKTEPNGEMGVVTAVMSSPQENGMVDLLRLSGTSMVRPGQTVVTSGEGGVFPEGILIGKVVDFRSRDYGMTTEARVKLAVNLGALEEVWVKYP